MDDTPINYFVCTERQLQQLCHYDPKYNYRIQSDESIIITYPDKWSLRFLYQDGIIRAASFIGSDKYEQSLVFSKKVLKNLLSKNEKIYR